jgi:hypothetical protein
MDSISARDRYGWTTNVVKQCPTTQATTGTCSKKKKLQQARAQSSGTSEAYLLYNLRLGNKVSIHYVLVSVKERITG